MAFTARDDKGKVLLFVRALNSISAKPLAGTDAAVYPFCSPDSRALGFFADGKLKKIDADGGPPQTLADASGGRGGAWSKDDVIVFAPSHTRGLMRIPAAGGTPEPASNLDTSRSENSHRWPYFLPDGKHFLFWARDSRGLQEHTLCVGTLGSLQARVLAQSESMAVYASGYLFFLRGQTLVAQRFDSQRTEIVGDAIPVAEHVAYDANRNRPIFSTSDNGVLVYQPGEMAIPDEKLAWFTRDGKESSVISQGDDFQGPALSPDGTHLAVAIVNAGLTTENIWIFDLQRGIKTRLTFGGGIQSFPVWTPDGKNVYYTSNIQGPVHIYARAADGTGDEQAVVGGADDRVAPGSVSPDGKYLAYVFRSASDARGIFDIWVLPPSGDGKPFPFVHNGFNSGRPAISPDGKWMAYSNRESGREEIYITAFPAGGAKWQVSASGGTQPQWRKDGRELFFLDPSNNFMAVDVNAANITVKLGIPHVPFQATWG
jgi:hypothetical protein